jgi:hypothetical protein
MSNEGTTEHLVALKVIGLVCVGLFLLTLVGMYLSHN